VALGVASMAETGLLLDQETREARTPFVPWFDRAAALYAEQITQTSERFERFCATGQYPSFKSSLAKLLALRERDASLLDGAVWLSTADYIVYRLTGAWRTDPTLATRTYAFRIDHGAWDTAWPRHWEVSPDLFPAVEQSGAPAGTVRSNTARQLGLADTTTAAVAGHDHVCAALAGAAVDAGTVFNSLGTAETLIGAVPMQSLGKAEYDGGLGYGCHVVPDRLYWMGGLSASGGSIEWLRPLLGEPALSYADLNVLVHEVGSDPTGIMYLPYLLGSGTPHPDAQATGALVGLRATHTRAHISKAVLEGTAYELEFIRRAAERTTKAPIRSVVAAGGGTRNRHWMQIKADVGGVPIQVMRVPEATVWGAALLAGIGRGVYRDAAEAVAVVERQPRTTFMPDPKRHGAYRRLYEEAYVPLQAPLRQISHTLAQQRAQR
jgi:xylulokinase